MCCYKLSLVDFLWWGGQVIGGIYTSTSDVESEFEDLRR